MIAAITALNCRADLPIGDDFSIGSNSILPIDYLFYCVIVVAAYMLQHYSDLRRRSTRLATRGRPGTDAIFGPSGSTSIHIFLQYATGISVLALAGERDCARQMLGRLSSLLRVSFESIDRSRFRSSAEMNLSMHLAIHSCSR